MTGREHEKQRKEESKGTEKGESMDVVRAYLRFFNLAFSVSAQQATAFCFELGRNQTMSAQKKELPTTLESFSGLSSTHCHPFTHCPSDDVEEMLLVDNAMRRMCVKSRIVATLYCAFKIT